MEEKESQEIRLKIYNTLSGRKEKIEPIKKSKISMFVCGPTVYDSIHVGHARTYLIYDILVRYLNAKGFSTKFIVNITDIDDKVFEKAKKNNISFIKLSEKYTQEFIDCLKKLGITTINDFPRASNYLNEIENQIIRLLANEKAYRAEGDIFFNVSSFKDYGKLSGLKKSELILRRLELNPKKRDQIDFQLWRSGIDDYPRFPSKLGKGRPGWHIEDTAISMSNFGDQYDIHGGAIDLIFPHHEAEIAQAESISGKQPFVKYWIHTGLLLVKGKKMSKSLGNFVILKDLLKKVEPNALRLYLISRHYREQFNFENESLEKFENIINFIYNSISRIRSKVNKNRDLKVDEKYVKYIDRFYRAIDNDLNTPRAIESLISLLKSIEGNNLPINKTLFKNIKDILFIIGIEINKLKDFE